jgi:hypothetical protein
MHLEMRVTPKCLDRDKRAAKTISLTFLGAAVVAPLPIVPDNSGEIGADFVMW